MFKSSTLKGSKSPAAPTVQARHGQRAEDRALRHAEQAGLRVLARNYRVARGPHAAGGEIDLVMQASDGTVVFIEVKQRSRTRHGGAAAAVSRQKQARVALAAQHFLADWILPPPCRFDVMALEPGRLHWIQGAFEAPGER